MPQLNGIRNLGSDGYGTELGVYYSMNECYADINILFELDKKKSTSFNLFKSPKLVNRNIILAKQSNGEENV